MKGKLTTGRLCWAFGFLALTVMDVQAQDCAQIADPMKRVECYDKSAVAKPKQPSVNKQGAAVQSAVRRSLKDPGSARFGEQTIINPKYACQTVNSRNSFGGYEGPQQAIVVKLGGQWRTANIEKISHERCVEIANQLKEQHP